MRVYRETRIIIFASTPEERTREYHSCVASYGQPFGRDRFELGGGPVTIADVYRFDAGKDNVLTLSLHMRGGDEPLELEPLNLN